MTAGIGALPRWLPRTACLLLILAALAGPAHRPRSAFAAPATDDGPLDLAAMTLTPQDLAAEGLDGFGLADGATLSPKDVASALAFERNLPEDETSDYFEDAGLVQAYELRVDQSTDTGETIEGVRSSVQVYEDGESAADAFAVFADWEDSPTADEIGADAEFADDIALVRLTGTTANPYNALELTFRSGRIIASVRLVDLTGETPAEHVVERLAMRLLARIETIVDQPTANLGSLTLRVAGEGVSPIWDFYTVDNGRKRGESRESADDIAAGNEALADAGVTEEYEVSQRIATSGLADQDTYLYSSVQRFVDVDAAEVALRGRGERAAEDDQFDDYEEVAGLERYGDDSIAFTQTFHWAANDVDLVYATYVLQVGSMLAQIQLIAPQATPFEALEDLAAAQANCLDAGACGQAASLPPDLASLVEQREAYTGTAPGPPPPDSAHAEPGTYIGPIFGAELTYDPTVWDVMLEQSSDGTDMLSLFEDGTTSMVSISAYPAGHGADACIADLTSGFADDEAFGKVKPVVDQHGNPIAEGDEDRAFAAYGLVAEDGAQTFVYFECRTFAGGDATLLITQVGPLDLFGARAASRASLLDNLDLPS